VKMMNEKNIQVAVLDEKGTDNRWGVVFSGDERNISVKMPSKEDAVRYARICEQRTGNKVLLPE